MVDELLLAWGAVRADVTLVNGTLEGFEIKAAKDTLKRLPAQIEAYDAIFEYAWLVTTTNHLREARAVLPVWWGILVANEGQTGLGVWAADDLTSVDGDSMGRASSIARSNCERSAARRWDEA